MPDADWERQHDRRMAELKARIEKARGPWEELALGRLGLDLGEWHTRGPACRLFNKVDRALSALREWRRANNQQESPQDVVVLAIRVTAEELATQLAESASGRPDLDEATIAWVLAGLRCPAAPFCQGCGKCFTVTAPNRDTPTFGLP